MISFFVPIRKGSKRVKNKNIKKVQNFSLGLTEIKIKQFLKLKNSLGKKYEFEFVIATNCKKTLNYCKKLSWIKTFVRREKISGDYSLNHMINLAPKICKGPLILWTHVTSPLFNSDCYKDFIESYKKKKTNRSAFSADTIKKFIFNEKKKWVSHNQSVNKWPRTQDLNGTYIVNSAAFIATKKIYFKQKDRLCSNPFPIISKKNTGFDVDSNEDFTSLKKMRIVI